MHKIILSSFCCVSEADPRKVSIHFFIQGEIHVTILKGRKKNNHAIFFKRKITVESIIFFIPKQFWRQQ